MICPFSSTAWSSTHTSNASTVPPGKKWPTLRVRTTTSTRTVSPRRTAASARLSGAVTGCTGSPSPPVAFVSTLLSSPTAKVVDRSPPGSIEPPVLASAGPMAKTSTVTASFRNASVAFS